jgi:hypothetical protein
VERKTLRLSSWRKAVGAGSTKALTAFGRAVQLGGRAMDDHGRIGSRPATNFSKGMDLTCKPAASH